MPTPLVRRPDLDRVWLSEMTIDDFTVPTSADEAWARSNRFKCVAQSEALHALAGRQLSHGEFGVYIDVLLSDDAELVYGFAQFAGGMFIELLQLRLDPASGSLDLLVAESRPAAAQADIIDQMFAVPYAAALGDELNAAVQELSEARRWLNWLARELGDPGSMARTAPAEEVRYWCCKTAILVLTEPDSDRRCVADAMVETWTGSAPDLLATVDAVTLLPGQRKIQGRRRSCTPPPTHGR